MTDEFPEPPDRTVFQPGRSTWVPPAHAGPVADETTPAEPQAPAAEQPSGAEPEPGIKPAAGEAMASNIEGGAEPSPEELQGIESTSPFSGDSERTVFHPGSRPPSTTPPDPRAVAGSATTASARPPSPEAVSDGPSTAELPPSAATPGGFHAIQPGTYGRVEVGSVLNNIFQVTRFIARGGMGEVFEGVNVNTDERVAIKVILPALAQDPTVQAMFRKEARTLTRLQHPALVNYRVLAQEPQLNVLYIVTEFIQGQALSDVMGRLKPTEAELRALMRCLCEGLRAAHALGAIHRDLSPDNVLLTGERIDEAKIIDFGIAKDLDASTGTIVGDGFAGKLGYVAPEQFGDFNREIGPWTDVYSLALTVLAVAQGRNVDMGSTLVEAIDRRRAGPDLSAAPQDLRPVLAQMLEADPAKRLRSMEAVLQALDGPADPTRFTAPPSATAAPVALLATPEKPSNRLPLLIGAGVAAVLVLVLAGGAVALMSGKPHAPAPVAASPAVASAKDGPGAARQAVETALPYLGCTWLDLDQVSNGPSGLSLALKGVAGSPGSVQAAVSTAATNAGAKVASVDLQNVAPVGAPVCSALDAFRLIRDTSPGAATRLTTAKIVYRMTPDAAGKPSARAEIGIDVGQPDLDFALFGLEPDGKIDPILTSRAMAEGLIGGPSLKKTGPDSYLLPLDTDHAGWSGLLLLRGKGPFDAGLIAAPAAQRSGAWPERFKAAADAGGWSADMVWYKTVR